MAVIAPIGCETRETLIGKWEGPRERPKFISEEMWPHTAKPLYKVEFFEDGTFTFNSKRYGERDPLEGSYQLLDNQNIAYQVTTRVKRGMRYEVGWGYPGPTFKGELRKGKLTVTDPESGVVVLLDKVK